MAIQHLIRVLAINMVWLSRRNRRGIRAISTIHRKHKIQIRAILRGHYRRAQQFNAKQNKYKHKTQRSTFTIIRAQSARYQHNISTIRRMSLVCSPCDTVTLCLFPCDTVPVPLWHCACTCVTLYLYLCDTVPVPVWHCACACVTRRQHSSAQWQIQTVHCFKLNIIYCPVYKSIGALYYPVHLDR